MTTGPTNDLPPVASAAPAGRSWRLARVTAPLARAMAGRRFFPLWAVVHHRGRRTGRELAVPVAVRVRPEAFLVVLPWGPATNWARNVLVAGGCVLTWKGRQVRVTAPELVGPAEARAFFPSPMWAFVRRVMKAETFLLLHR